MQPLAGIDAWHETQLALHLRTQVLGKTRLALSPAQNHWWHTVLYVTARGLSTSAMPTTAGTLDIELDLIDHLLTMRRGDGAIRTLALRAQPVSDFFDEYVGLLRSLDVAVRIWPMPVEISDPIRFTDDHRPLAYDREAATTFFRALADVDVALQVFRGRFVGKCSPSHFWWGSFDLSCTRFSGRRAPEHPGGIPNLADWVTREAYSHECISAGWWPGSPAGPIREPAFYAYAYPEPPGCAEAPLRVKGARYDLALHEWILPHHAVIGSDDPQGVALEFLQDTYDIAARLGVWSPELVTRRSDHHVPHG